MEKAKPSYLERMHEDDHPEEETKKEEEEIIAALADGDNAYQLQTE